jgi:hypothetical protein
VVPWLEVRPLVKIAGRREEMMVMAEREGALPT